MPQHPQVLSASGFPASPPSSVVAFPALQTRREPFVLLEENLLSPAKLRLAFAPREGHGELGVPPPRGPPHLCEGGQGEPAMQAEMSFGDRACTCGSTESQRVGVQVQPPPRQDGQQFAMCPGSPLAAGRVMQPQADEASSTLPRSRRWRSTPGHGSEHSGKVLQRKQGTAARRSARGAAAKRLKHQPDSAPPSPSSGWLSSPSPPLQS